MENIETIDKTSSEFFILQDYWILFKLFQIMGIFPWKKGTNENGTIQLRPMKLCLSILLLSILCVILLVPQGRIVFIVVFFHVYHIVPEKYPTLQIFDS